MSSRFSRQVRLAEVGVWGQQAFENSKILVVGMGGLGCPSAQYLIAAGVGCLGLVDGDRVEESNLHRQILYSDQDIGRPKVEAAAARLRSMSSQAKIVCYFEQLNSGNVHSILDAYDIVLDCSDNFEAKYLLNDTCLQMGKTLVLASATGFEASLLVVAPNGPCLRCLYSNAASTDIGSCDLTGVLGACVGVVGAWQAVEVLKIILSLGGRGQSFSSPSGQVLFFDFYASRLRSVQLPRSLDCVCAGVSKARHLPENESLYLSAEQVRGLSDGVVVDVRSSEEREREPLNGFEAIENLHIPYPEIVSGELGNEFWLPRKKYVFCCTMGKRSMMAARWLRDHGIQGAYSLRRS